MKTFRLTKVSSNKVRTRFHVLDSKGDIVGSVNVPVGQEADLLRHWVGPADRATNQPPVANAKVRPLQSMSRAAILRGC
jgi:hypothetical protein